jgi:hypothetical protein
MYRRHAFEDHGEALATRIHHTSLFYDGQEFRGMFNGYIGSPNHANKNFDQIGSGRPGSFSALGDILGNCQIVPSTGRTTPLVGSIARLTQCF